MRAVSWLRRLVAGLSPRRPGFDPRSIYVRFVLKSVELRQVSFRIFLFTPTNITPLLLHTDFHLYILGVFRNTDERSQGKFTNANFHAEIWRMLVKKYFDFYYAFAHKRNRGILRLGHFITASVFSDLHFTLLKAIYLSSFLLQPFKYFDQLKYEID